MNCERANMNLQIAEKLVKEILEKKHWVVYEPKTDGAHAFDMLAIKDKRTCVAIDVKAKARMTYLPATGINEDHFQVYQEFSKKHNMAFWLIFVDENTNEIYGNRITELEKQRVFEGRYYPMHIRTRFGKQVRLWPLSAMIRIATLNDSEANELINMSQRNYEYV
jgi:hypothetical protein